MTEATAVATTQVWAHGPTNEGGRDWQQVQLRWWQDETTGDFQVWTSDGLPAQLAGADRSLYGALRALGSLLQEQGWMVLVAGARRDACWPGPQCRATHVWLYPSRDGEATAEVHALDPLQPEVDEEASTLAPVGDEQDAYHQKRLDSSWKSS